VDSQKSLISVDIQLPKFPNGQILFDDGLQRLGQVN
jgi:hypothetical protein